MNKKLVILSMTTAGMALSTPLYSIHAESAVVQPLVVETLQRMEKSSLSNMEFVAQLIKENNNDGEKLVDIWKLGDGSSYKDNVKLKDLVAALPENVQFAVINHKNMHYRTVFVVDKNDEFVNTKEEYDKLYEQYGNQIFAGKQIHTQLTKLDRHPHLRTWLGANGLFSRNINMIGTSGLNINSQVLGLATDYWRARSGLPSVEEESFEKFKANDERLIELIKTAKADQPENDEEKVRNWLVYVLNNIPYDFGEYSAETGRGDYIKSSNIYAVATRRLAMCLGFSQATARAFNMLGIPAYVVEGNIITRGANGGTDYAAHATVRAYYNGAWHTIDPTSSISLENTPSHVYNSQNYRSRIDQYELGDVSRRNYSQEVSNPTGKMTINKEFEEWAETQMTKDLLYINSDVALKNRIPSIISQELKQTLIQRYEKMEQALKDYIKKVDEKHKYNSESLLASVVTELQEIRDKVLDLDNYNKYNKSYNIIEFFYNQMAQFANQKDENFSKELQDLKNKSDDLYQKDEEKYKRLSQLPMKEAEAEFKKGLQEEIEAKRKAEEQAKQEVEAKRKAEEQAKQEAEAKRKAEEHAKQEAEAKRKAEEQAKQEAEAKRKAEEQVKQEAEAKRKAEEQAKQEAEAKRKAEEQAKQEAEAKRKAEEQAKQEAEAKRKAEEQAKQEAEAKRKVEEQAKQEAEAKRKAEEQAKQEVEAKRKAEEQAKREAEEQAKRKAEEQAKTKTVAQRKTDQQVKPEGAIQRKFNGRVQLYSTIQNKFNERTQVETATQNRANEQTQIVVETQRKVDNQVKPEVETKSETTTQVQTKKLEEQKTSKAEDGSLPLKVMGALLGVGLGIWFFFKRVMTKK